MPKIFFTLFVNLLYAYYYIKLFFAYYLFIYNYMHFILVIVALLLNNFNVNNRLYTLII